MVALRFRPRLLIIPGLLVVAAGLSIAQSVAAGTLLLMWYLLPVVIGWVLLMGTGPEPEDMSRARAVAMAAGRGGNRHGRGVSHCLDRRPPWPWRPCRASRCVKRRSRPGRGYRPIRDAVVAAVAGSRVHAVVGISDGQMKLYAPAVITVKSLADLEEVEAQATAAGKNLWISVGGWEASRARSPEVVARLEGGAYEKVADLPGWEPMFSYQVWRRR